MAENVKVFDNHRSVPPDSLQAGTEVVVGGPITVNGGASTPSATPRTTYTAQIVLVQSAQSSGMPSTSTS